MAVEQLRWESATMGRHERAFEAVWTQIQQKLAPGDTIRNWSQYSGYRVTTSRFMRSRPGW